MKNNRQAAIRRILSERPVETQEELAEALREMGFQATQATVSRDMKEMRLIKKPVPGGSFRYTMPEPTESFSNERLIRILRDAVIEIDRAGQLLVVKTLSGSANIAAEALDTMRIPEIIGSIAGDNTVFLAARDPDSAGKAEERIRGFLPIGGEYAAEE